MRGNVRRLSRRCETAASSVLQATPPTDRSVLGARGKSIQLTSSTDLHAVFNGRKRTAAGLCSCEPLDPARITVKRATTEPCRQPYPRCPNAEEEPYSSLARGCEQRHRESIPFKHHRPPSVHSMPKALQQAAELQSINAEEKLGCSFARKAGVQRWPRPIYKADT